MERITELTALHPEVRQDKTVGCSGSALWGWTQRACIDHCSCSEIFPVCSLSRQSLLQASVCSRAVGKFSYPEPSPRYSEIIGWWSRYRASYCEFHIDPFSLLQCIAAFLRQMDTNRYQAVMLSFSDNWALMKSHLSNPPAKRTVSIEVSVWLQGRGGDLILIQESK